MSDGRDLTDLPLELTSDLRDVVVTVSSRGARVSGTAQKRDTKDPDPSVMLFPTDSRYWVDFSSYARRIKETRTGRDGSFSLGDLPAGDYYIVGRAPCRPGLVAAGIVPAAEPGRDEDHVH